MTDFRSNPTESKLLRRKGTWLCAMAAVFTMAAAHAATSPDELQVPDNAMTPKQAYEHDKAYCKSGQSTQPQAVCLKEAARAYQEARAGTLLRSGDQQTASHKSQKQQRTARKAGNSAETSTSGTADIKAPGTASDSPYPMSDGAAAPEPPTGTQPDMQQDNSK
jgi:hypothetical protein